MLLLQETCDANGETDQVFGINCGCEECNDSALGALATDFAGTFTCGARIMFLMERYEMAEFQACERVAAEFPNECAPSKLATKRRLYVIALPWLTHLLTYSSRLQS
jgi:hypothetical protein